MKRRVVVNGRYLCRRITGVERYARNVISWLPEPVDVHAPDWGVEGAFGHLWEQLLLPQAVPQDSILWSPANSGPLFLRRQALTIHDLSPLDQPQWFTPAYARWARLALPLLARRVEKILTVSRFSQGRIVDRLKIPPEKIFIIPPGVDSQSFRPANQTAVARVRHDYELSGTYILYVGSLQGRKNLSNLLQAWQALHGGKPAVTLVLAGATAPIFGAPVVHDPPEGVCLPGYVPDADLPALYSGAAAAVFVSFYEGFCLTGLEAMACGCPVIAANIPPFHEALGEAAYYVDPHNVAEIAAALHRFAEDPALGEYYRALGYAQASRFTWEQTAVGVWQALQAS